ncbi:EF-hand domain-containing protein [Undibacterium sp. CY18W]|uniref:EF-hand domain-containing protein n=1 Tax=Undibacterium hunanense TaxID=2762292 RepID=A0ABR6ZS66_9BURK|nr:EF-hand domain-containing protein [Undibacterium hunanense]MBC3918693.1 EF-hand domain-containing protein [Undibacterium hunanense]
MTSVSGVSGSSNYYSQASSGVQRHGRGDPAKLADSVFSKLDTKNQGYLEISDLETAFGNISGTSSSTTSATSSTASTGTSSTSNSSTVNDLFKKLDSDGDGKVTKDEFSSGIKKLSDELETQFNARRTSGARPPPPPDGGGQGEDGGLDKTQLTDLASKVGESNSSAGAALTQVAQNFEAADTNQDGKVSLQESIAYLEKTASASGTTSTGTSTSTSATASTTSTSASSGTSTSSDSTGTSATSGTSGTTASSSTDSTSSTSDAAIFKKALQLLRAYAVPPQDQTQGLSVTA